MKKKISKYISFAEATRSTTAQVLKIKNTPTQEHLENMMLVAEKVFEPLREYAGHPIGVNSFYRSPELNKAIRGSSKSSHMIGAAIDLKTLGDKTNKELFNFIVSELSFDQCIWEFGTNEDPAWVHVSYLNEQQNRNQVLKVNKRNPKIYHVLK